MTRQELRERIRIAELKFLETEETIADIVRDIEQYSAENPEFCEMFWDKELKEQGTACQEQLKGSNRLMQASFVAMIKKTELEKDYSQLISDKKFLEGSGVPLVMLLGMLSPKKNAALQEAYFTDSDGMRRNPEKVSSEYDTLKEKLKKEAVDAESFKKAITLRKRRTESGEPLIKGEVKAGIIITFGKYPQTAEGKDQTPIEWLVLEVKDGKALLISKYGIDCKRYNENFGDITWEHCSLRKWLNEEFIQKAFEPGEQKRISLTSVPADKNPEYKTTPGNATTDKVFLLSIPEVEKYFKSNEDRKTALTAYAKKQVAYTNDKYKTADGKAACWWWLRSPGHRGSHAADVDDVGSVHYYGIYVHVGNDCVRPALWINLEF